MQSVLSSFYTHKIFPCGQYLPTEFFVCFNGLIAHTFAP